MPQGSIATSQPQLLVPSQLTTTQRNAASAPHGRIIYNTTTGSTEVFQGGSAGWVQLPSQSLGPTSNPTFAGLALNAMTQGSVIFAGAGGVLSQDNANLFYDPTNNALLMGITSYANARLEVVENIRIAGTGSSSKWAGNFNTAINVGGYVQIGALELDVTCLTGSSPVTKTALNIVLGPNDSVQGSGTGGDAAIAFYAASTSTAGWKNLLLIDQQAGHGTTIDPTNGSVISSVGSVTMKNGIDLSGSTITANFLAGPNNFVVTGSGNMGIGTTSAPLAKLDIKGVLDEHILLSGHDHLATGTAIRSINGAGNILLPLEIEGSQISFTVAGVTILNYNITNSNAWTFNQAIMFQTATTLTNGAASSAGTLTNAPAAGNPTKWVPINDNGTTRYIPAW